VDRDADQSTTPAPDAQDQTSEQAPEADETASPPSRETQNGLMNRFLRGVGSLFRDEDASDDAPPEQAPAKEPDASSTPPEPERLTMTADEFRRAVQSAKDRELVAERRQAATEAAEQGDLAPIRKLAERGDGWARHQLAERGDTWALGEIAQAEEIARAKAAEDPVPAIATSFDQAVLWPLLAALPRDEEARIVGQGIVGLAGRQQAVEDAIGVVRREAATAALADEKFVASLLKSESFRAALIKTPAANKQFRAFFRGETEEPDHVPAAASSRRRENDFMNDLLRGLTPAEPDQGD
jgi:hypothetical protein